MDETRDERLWRIARRRAAFRKSVYSYLVVNGFLWAIWWFTTGRLGQFGFPWPLWVMLGWGLGLLKQYYDAFKDDDAQAEREYEKMKRNKM